MKKLYNILMILAFLAVIFYFPIKTKLEPPAETSFIENRALEAAPVFTKEGLFDGSYLPKWESYYSDHIAHRDAMIYYYTYLNANILKKNVVNNIVIADDLLLPFYQPTVTDREKIKSDSEKMADKLSSLQEAVENIGGEFLYVGVPEQSSMLREEYPDFLENRDEFMTATEEEFFSALDSRGVRYLNMRNVFEKENYRAYYSSTDHHYNIDGAFKTYEEIIKVLGIEGCLTSDGFNRVTLENTFFGSRAKFIYNAYAIEEKLSYFEPKVPVSFKRYDRGNEVKRIFFAPADVETNIAYSVYMGGDNAETFIYTDRPELKRILIFGDSFTNPLETIMYPSFDAMLAVDLRHNKEKSIYQYIEEFEPDIVLLVRDDTCYLSFDGNGSF